MYRNKIGVKSKRELTQLLHVLRSFKTEAAAIGFFQELFTRAEIEDFALRWRLLKMLKSGVPQRKIAARLGISLCKITRGSKVLKKRNSKIKQVLPK